MTDVSSLITAIRERTAVLFVGSGLSKNLGLPTWGEMIDEMAVELGFDPEVFATYGGYHELAEYYLLQKGTFGAFRSKMDSKWHSDQVRVDASEHHRLILDLNFPIIYTTNYDRWLEIAHERKGRTFTRIASIEDFPKIRDGLTQIVKFHGDFWDDRSIVISERHYFERLDYESPMDIKFRSDSLGKAFLFIGYSISDVNIRRLLYMLSRLWETSALPRVRPASFIFLSRPNPIQEEILKQRGIHSVVSEEDDPSAGLLRFLKQLADGVNRR